MHLDCTVHAQFTDHFVMYSPMAVPISFGREAWLEGVEGRVICVFFKNEKYTRRKYVSTQFRMNWDDFKGNREHTEGFYILLIVLNIKNPA